MGGDSSLLKKIIALLVGIVITAVCFLLANDSWRNDPSTFTAVIRLVALFPLIILLTIWFLIRNTTEKGLVIVCFLSITVGMVLNSIAIISNDGRMPIDPSLMAAGFPKYYVNGGNMLWLGDSLWMGSSIGDCFCYFAMILLGYLLIKFVVEGIKGRLNR